jgi:hypothetical protein
METFEAELAALTDNTGKYGETYVIHGRATHAPNSLPGELRAQVSRASVKAVPPRFDVFGVRLFDASGEQVLWSPRHFTTAFYREPGQTIFVPTLVHKPRQVQPELVQGKMVLIRFADEAPVSAQTYTGVLRVAAFCGQTAAGGYIQQELALLHVGIPEPLLEALPPS